MLNLYCCISSGAASDVATDIAPTTKEDRPTSCKLTTSGFTLAPSSKWTRELLKL
jgi:hypothetical protein